MPTKPLSFFLRLFGAAMLVSLFFGAQGGVASVSAGTDIWTTNGPGSGWILGLAIDPSTPSTVYAGTWGSGVYKSTDAGASWFPTNNGLTDSSINTLAMDPQTTSTLYVGTYHGIFKSVDSGATWSEANDGITDYQIQTLAIDPFNPSIVYAGAFGSVFKSTDGGESWSAKNNGLTNIHVWVMAVDPLDPGTLYAGTGFEGVFKSTDGGESWRAVNTGLYQTNIYSLAVNPLTPGTLYVGTEHGGIWRSTDGGGNWENVLSTLPDAYLSVRSMAIDPKSSATVYAGTDQGMFKSMDSGQSWTQINAGLNMDSDVTALAIQPSAPDTVYAGTWNDGGVYKTADSGSHWTLVNTGLANTAVYSLVIDPREPSILYAGTSEFGVFKSNDAGESWFSINDGLPKFDIGMLAIDPSTPSTLYAGTYDRLFKSLDGGEHWFSIDEDLSVSDVDALVVEPSSPLTLYAGTFGGGVFKSTDGGLHWQQRNHGLTVLSISALVIDPAVPNTLYAGTSGGGVFKSLNGGADWFPINNGLYFSDVRALAIDPVTTTTLYVGIYEGVVFKSLNGGTDWFPANEGLFASYIADLAIDPLLPSTLYAATYSGVFKSTDGGKHWSDMNTGLTNVHINALAINPLDPTTLYAGTNGAGVAKYSSSFIPCRAMAGQVVVNEIFPSPANNGTEWVELYNTTDHPIHVGSCYIDDIPAAGSPPVQIPAGTIIPAHGFWTLNQISYFNNAGDSARFLKEDANTVLDTFTYGNTLNDLSWVRIPDGGPWAGSPTASTTRGKSNQKTQNYPSGTTRISISSNGTEGNSHSFFSSMSSDGRYIAFQSDASNLVNGDTNGTWDIFLRDRQVGTTTRVSIASDGTQANALSDIPSISGDGRYVVFSSSASNLVNGDTNQSMDVFIRDTQTNTTSLVSLGANGAQGNSHSNNPSISTDGRFVVFESNASNLVEGDTNGKADVFVRDLQANSTIRVSIASDGTQGNDESRSWGFGLTPSISSDGRYIAFPSDSSNLVSGDTNGSGDIFLRDTVTNTTILVSVALNGAQANGGSYAPSLSGDGHLISFGSGATNLVMADTNGSEDIFVRDLLTNTTKRISVSTNGSEGTGGNVSPIPSMSGNGRYVAFTSGFDNLVGGDTNAKADVFLRDLLSNTTSRMSISSDGTQGNDDSSNPILWTRPSISSNGQFIAFASLATNLVGNDTNDMQDIFIRDSSTSTPSFADVPSTHPYYQDIQILYANGLTGGCANNPLRFCPDQILNRGAAAVFMLRANFGSSYVPPVPTHIFKDDWSKGKWAEPWAEGMKLEGLSAGCLANPLKYCPWTQIPREQAVIFVLRLKNGKLYTPPPATGTLFADMTDPGYYATSWAEQAYKDGLIPNCGMSGGKPMFCPKDLVSRGLAAYMIVRAKNLTMP